MAPKRDLYVRRSADGSLPQDVTDADCAAYRAGVSLTELSAGLGRSMAWTKKHLEKHGVIVRGFNYRGGQTELTDEDHAAYAGGQSLDDMAARTGRSPKWCRDQLAAAGVTIRPFDAIRPKGRKYQIGYDPAGPQPRGRK